MSELPDESPRSVIDGTLLSLGFFCFDVLGVVSAFVLIFYLRRWLGNQGILFDELIPSLSFFFSYWPVVFLWPLFLWLEGLYPGSWKTPDQELRSIITGATLAGGTIVALTFLTQTGAAFSRPILVGWWLMSLILLPINRFGLKLLLPSVGLRGEPAVLLGTNEAAVEVLRSLTGRDIPVVDPIAAFRHPDEPLVAEIEDVPVLGQLDDSIAYARQHAVRLAILVLPQLPQRQLIHLNDKLSGTFRRVLVVPNLHGLSTAETDVRDIDGVLALELRRNLLSPRSRLTKRLLDVALASMIGLAAIPLMAVIGLALVMERQGSILFAHRRVGRSGETFTAWKFRTMVADADRKLQEALLSDPVLKREWQSRQKLRVDPRMTVVGRFLRRFSFDELPQLWNVVRGEMSLVGPRPVVEAELAKYGEAIELYFQVRPGLTGLWQVSGRSNLSYEERVRLDSYYVRNWSVWLDFVILLRTFLAVVTGRGAY